MVDVAIAGHVDDHLLDRAAGERERSAIGVIRCDRRRAVAPDTDAVADGAEETRLGSDRVGSDGLVVDVESQGSFEAGHVGIGARPGLVELRDDNVVTLGDRTVRRDRLHLRADPVERVVHPLVLHVEAVSASDATVRVEHPLGGVGVERHPGVDRVRASVDPDAGELGDVGAVREVLVPVAVGRCVRAVGEDLLERGAVVERETVVDACVVEPQVLQLPQPFGVVSRDVLAL